MISPEKVALNEDTPLLTVASIRSLKQAISNMTRAIEEMTKKIEEDNRRLNAAMMFVPEGFDIEAPEIEAPETVKPLPPVVHAPANKTIAKTGSRGGRRGALTWRSEVQRIISASKVGLTYKDLMDECLKTPLVNMRFNGDKGFYTAISKLIKLGVIVKSHDYLYSNKLAMEMKERGEELYSTRFRKDSSSLIIEILAEYSNGLTAPQLRDIAGKHPDAPKSMPQGNLIYNLLNKAIRNGYVVKSEQGIYMRTNKVEPTTADSNRGLDLQPRL